MPDDNFLISALASRFRAKLAAPPATLTTTTLNTYADAALAALVEGTTIVSLSLEGGGSSAQINCPPGVLLAACNLILAEQETDAVTGTGATHLDLSGVTIET